MDLTRISDPDLISLPPIHEGDIGLGNPFSVVCESIEAIYVIDGEQLLLGCDNNLPNKGRNPGLADDNEFILVRVPGLITTGNIEVECDDAAVEGASWRAIWAQVALRHPAWILGGLGLEGPAPLCARAPSFR